MGKKIIEYFENCIFNSSNKNHSYSLTGKAGCGKTTVLRELAKRILEKNSEYIPIYISLKAIRADSSVFEYIAETYLIDVDVSNVHNSLTTMLNTYNYKYVILLDDYSLALNSEAINKDIKYLSEFKDVYLIVATTIKPDFLPEFKAIEIQNFSDDTVNELINNDNKIDEDIKSLLYQPYYMFRYLSNQTVSTLTAPELVNSKVKWICDKYKSAKALSVLAGFSYSLLLPYLAERFIMPDFNIENTNEAWQDLSNNYDKNLIAQYSEITEGLIAEKGLTGAIAYLIDEFFVKHNILNKTISDGIIKYSFENDVEKLYFKNIMDKINKDYRQKIEASVHTKASGNIYYFENHRLVEVFTNSIKKHQIVIIMGVGGYGKTTLINNINSIKKMVIDCKNHKSWAMLDLLFNDNNEKYKNAEYIVCDNFRTLTTEDYSRICKNIGNKKLIISCRTCEFSDNAGSNITFIDCNKYTYDMNIMLKKSYNNKMPSYSNNLLRLLGRLPDFMNTPLFFKLICNISNNNKKLSALYMLCNSRNKNEGESDFINKFFDIYFEALLTPDEYRLLIMFSIITRDMVYYEDKLKEFFYEINIITNSNNSSYKVENTDNNYYDKIKALFKDKLFVDRVDDNGLYLHSVFADYFLYYFAYKLDDKQKISFLNSSLFTSVVYNANNKLESGIAVQYKDKISFLPYSYNLQQFICNYIFKGIEEITEKIDKTKLLTDMFNFVNSYTFLLVKSYSSLSEIREQIKIQEELVNAMYSNAISSRLKGDYYYKSLSAFNNVLLKVQLVLFVYYPKDIHFSTLLQSLYKNKKACEQICNENLKRLRSGIYSYTACLLYYKAVLLFDEIKNSLPQDFQNTQILFQKAKEMADLSLEYAIGDIINEYIKAENIENKLSEGDVTVVFENYDIAGYEKFYNQISEHKAIFREVRSCFASLELKCLVLALGIYYGLNISEDDCLKAFKFTCKGFVDNIRFSSINDDIMRFRQMLLLEIASGLFKNDELKTICQEVKGKKYTSENKDDDMRFEFLKYLVIEGYEGKCDFAFLCNIYSFDINFRNDLNYSKEFFYKILLS